MFRALNTSTSTGQIRGKSFVKTPQRAWISLCRHFIWISMQNSSIFVFKGDPTPRSYPKVSKVNRSEMLVLTVEKLWNLLISNRRFPTFFRSVPRMNDLFCHSFKNRSLCLSIFLSLSLFVSILQFCWRALIINRIFRWKVGKVADIERMWLLVFALNYSLKISKGLFLFLCNCKLIM